MKKDIGRAKNHLTILASLLQGILEMPGKGDNDIKTPSHLLLDMVFFSTAFLLKHILKISARTFRNTNLLSLKNPASIRGSPTEEVARPEPRPGGAG